MSTPISRIPTVRTLWVILVVCALSAPACTGSGNRSRTTVRQATAERARPERASPRIAKPWPITWILVLAVSADTMDEKASAFVLEHIATLPAKTCFSAVLVGDSDTSALEVAPLGGKRLRHLPRMLTTFNSKKTVLAEALGSVAKMLSEAKGCPKKAHVFVVTNRPLHSKGVLAAVRTLASKGTVVSAMGGGASVSTQLLRGIARVGKGRYFHVSKGDLPTLMHAIPVGR